MNDVLSTKIKKRARRNPDPTRRGTSTKVTPLMKKAIDLFQTQVFAGEYKPIEDTLLEAGYSPESARQVSNVMAGIKPHVEPIVAEMEEHRQAVMARMKATVDRATYGELTRSLDVTTRNIRLLSGKSTQNFALLAEHRHRLDILIEQ
jgi:hypothetical protein